MADDTQPKKSFEYNKSVKKSSGKADTTTNKRPCRRRVKNIRDKKEKAGISF